MIKKYHELTWQLNQHKNVLQAWLHPEMTPQLIARKGRFEFEVDRNRIVENSQDTLNKVYKPASGLVDELKLPIEIKFKGEEGLDYGGLRKEYFE
jgi:hypothetical protein